jgi:translocation and assembly module TamB
MTEEKSKPVKSRQAIWRKLLLGAGALGVLLLLLVLGVFIAFKTGYVDNYIKNTLIERFTDYGIRAEIESIKTTISPTTAELTNLQFFDAQTGEKLAKIDKLTLNLTVSNILGLRSSREMNINSTDVEGLEVWVRFDENGRSNFSNLKFKTDEDPNLKVSLASMNFQLKDAIVHYGDEMRKISGTAKNVKIFAAPEDLQVPENERRYRFDINSEKSVFNYHEKPIEPIDIFAKGIADKNGAEIEKLTLKTPLGESVLSGTVTNWQSPKYDLKISSSVDLQQTAGILPTGATLRGIGNFEGTVTGEGEKYRIEGEIDSQALSADNVYLKGLQINGKIAGERAIYEGNGKAIAEMLTFDDFQLDWLQLTGNVRGTGTDFKWFGELRAAAAKSPDGTLAGLFISDAYAEYKEKQFAASFGNLRAASFYSQDLLAERLELNDIKIDSKSNETVVNLSKAKAGRVNDAGLEMRGVDANGVKITAQGERTSAEVKNLRAESLQTTDGKLKNINADGLKLTDQNGATDIQVKNLQADGFDTDGAKIGKLSAGNVNLKERGNQTDVTSDTLRVARVETNAAVLADLNIAGVRMTIREGRIEAKSNDFDAGNVDLKGQGRLENAKVFKPVFVLEPSGRYRASLDLTLGRGVLGSINLGAARASVEADNDKITLNQMKAEVMDGKIDGNAVIAMSERGQSKFDADFANLDLAKILALQGGRVIPLDGKTTGKANLTFYGTNFKRASGTVTADFEAKAGNSERGLVPVNGNLNLKATDGVFDIEQAKLNTEKSQLEAKGRFDLNGDGSNLNFELVSSDADEIERLNRILEVSPKLTDQLALMEIDFAGNLNFNGKLTGNLQSPSLNGGAVFERVLVRGRELGSLTTQIAASPETVELKDAILREANGGTAEFYFQQPNLNNLSSNNLKLELRATLNRVNLGNLLTALKFEENLPENFREINAETSGRIELKDEVSTGASGFAELNSGAGKIGGQQFEGFETLLIFRGQSVNIEKFEARAADGLIRAEGNYQRDTTQFDFNLTGNNLQASRLRPFFSNSQDLPEFSGIIDLNARATGSKNDFSTYNINFKGAGQNVIINENAVGTVDFVGTTENQILKTDVTANLEGQKQIITATVNFADKNLPFRAETNFDQTELAPFIALLRPPGSVALTGKATGKVLAEGNLYAEDASGNKYLTTENIKGTAQFSEFALQFDETPIIATQPISISFNARELVVENARFAGAGSNLTVSGTKALNDKGINNLSVRGKVNLRLLNSISKNTFFSGLADVSVDLTGVNVNSRLSGSAEINNSSISTFIGSERLNFERIQAKVIFTSNQAQIERAVGYLGGGKVVGTGGALVEGLKLQGFRLELRGQNITAPLPKNFLTTGDAEVEVSSECVKDEKTGKCERGGDYNTLIAGTIFAKRSLYTKDIDLADLISGRREGSISEGTSSTQVFGIPRLDLRLQGRDALVVRNNLADLTASIDMRVTGDVDYPLISGRVTANSGTLFFRSDRYEVQRGTLEFPPQTNGEPVVNLQAETDIKGYQVFVNLSGELSNLDGLQANVRSNPALPQADVISLITTGNLSNTESGIPTYAQSGLNTAAEVITDSLINNPIRKATDKLFGLNKFEIDPILSGRRLNPSARLTVGRQINKNLAITYSTNLSEDQNQVLAFEYRVSNRLSFVAQYEQGSLSNVTRRNNNFSFEIRLRKRF